MYGKGHNSCTKKKEDTYIMDVGKFAKAYVGQKQLDYKYMGNNYGNPDALNYLTCTAVAYNDAYVSISWLLLLVAFFGDDDDDDDGACFFWDD